MVRIDISNRALLVYGVLFILFLSVGFVIAFNSGGPPSVMGHSAEEIEIEDSNGVIINLQEAFNNSGTIEFYDCEWIHIWGRDCNGVPGCDIQCGGVPPSCESDRVRLIQDGPYVVVGFDFHGSNYGDSFRVCKTRVV